MVVYYKPEGAEVKTAVFVQTLWTPMGIRAILNMDGKLQSVDLSDVYTKQPKE